MKNNIKLNDVISKGKFIKTLNPSDKKFHNQADLYLWQKNYYVVRTIGKQYILSNKQLIKLEKNLHKYYFLLKKCSGLWLPKIFITNLSKKKGVILLMTEYFSEGSVVKIQPITKRIKQLKTITQALIKLIISKDNISSDDKLICSLDINPNNFFLSKNSNIVYNDFTPPLYRENGIWFEFRRKDEIHALKNEKEKRYFSSINLLVSFVNKLRIYLSFTEYIKFIKWIYKIVEEKKFINNLSIFSKIFEEINHNPAMESCYKFKNYVGKRDLLRFALSLNNKLSANQIKEIYKKSKEEKGVLYLEKKLTKINFHNYEKGK